MYFLWIYQIIFLFLSKTFCQLVETNNNNHNIIIPSKLSLENPTNDNRLPIVANNNKSFNLIIRMIAFRIHQTDNKDDKQHKLDDTRSSEVNDDDFHRFKNKQLHENNRNLLLPLMIRMLLERMTKHTEINQINENFQKSDNVNNQSNMNKLNNVYKLVKKYINITTDDDVTKVEKIRIIIFVILIFAIISCTIFSSIHHLQDIHKYQTIRVNSSFANRNKNYEETKKLLS